MSSNLHQARLHGPAGAFIGPTPATTSTSRVMREISHDVLKPRRKPTKHKEPLSMPRPAANEPRPCRVHPSMWTKRPHEQLHASTLIHRLYRLCEDRTPNHNGGSPKRSPPNTEFRHRVSAPKRGAQPSAVMCVSPLFGRSRRPIL